MKKTMTLYAVLHDTCGRAYIGMNLFHTEADAREATDAVPEYLRENGQGDVAARWEVGRHEIVPVTLEIPEGWEVIA